MNTIRGMRDLAIALLAIWIIVLTMWVRLSPTLVGEWLADRDMGYGAVWADCDCTGSLE